MAKSRKVKQAVMAKNITNSKKRAKIQTENYKVLKALKD